MHLAQTLQFWIKHSISLKWWAFWEKLLYDRRFPSQDDARKQKQWTFSQQSPLIQGKNCDLWHFIPGEHFGSKFTPWEPSRLVLSYVYLMCFLYLFDSKFKASLFSYEQAYLFYERMMLQASFCTFLRFIDQDPPICRNSR